MINPEDKSTWPKGDRIWAICSAIAIAEGYGKKDSIPTKFCNPGDISDGCNIFPFEIHSGSKVVKFPSHEEGWTRLYNKILNASKGLSHVYLPSMTWRAFARMYAGNWEVWLKNVCHELNVDYDDIWTNYLQEK